MLCLLILVWCSEFWLWNDAVYSGFGLIHVLSIKQVRILVCSSSRHTLMNSILFPLLPHPPCHSAKRACLELQHPRFQCSPLTPVSFCTEGLPGVAESTVFISEGKPFPWGEFVRQGGWGMAKKGSSTTLTHRLWRSPLSRRTRVLCWMMDSATSPSAPHRMTGGGRYWESDIYYFRETNQKWVWCFVYGSLN